MGPGGPEPYHAPSNRRPLPYIEGVETGSSSQRPGDATDRERGLRDGRDALRLTLADAPRDYLEGALENPGVGPDEVILLLRNRATTTDMLRRVGRNPAWMRPREVKLALVANPRSPQILARRFLPHLFWRDLAEVASTLRVSPVVRRAAEKLLKVRLSELSSGEKISLARRASRGVVEALREESDALVLQALGGNPRLTEADVARILARADVPAAFLSWLADQSPWGPRRGVRLALVRHPRTPPSAALRLLQTLSRRDAEDLLRDVQTPRLVRIAAERRLDGTGADGGGRRPHFG